METISRLIVLSPDSQYSPSYLARAASALDLGIGIKQTCYGILIEGPEDVVDEALSKLKEIDSTRIFSKMRAFPLGDKRRCRAQHGSARPGFYFLEKEIDLLPIIAKGIECAQRGDTVEDTPPPRKLEPSELRKIMEETV